MSRRTSSILIASMAIIHSCIFSPPLNVCSLSEYYRGYIIKYLSNTGGFPKKLFAGIRVIFPLQKLSRCFLQVPAYLWLLRRHIHLYSYILSARRSLPYGHVHRRSYLPAPPPSPRKRQRAPSC